MKVLIAGGGTGGHLFPGIALAEAIGTASIDNVARYLGGQQADGPKTTYLEPRYIYKDNVDEVVSELGLTVGS